MNPIGFTESILIHMLLIPGGNIVHRADHGSREKLSFQGDFVIEAVEVQDIAKGTGLARF